MFLLLPVSSSLYANPCQETTLQGSLQISDDVARPRNSKLNPGNLLARLPEQVTQFQARPDFSTHCGDFDIRLSPRHQLSHESILSGLPDPRRDKDTRDEVLLQSGLLRYIPDGPWSLEFSRQALLWGPSMFFSPSNPFFTDNGRDTPHLEIPGKDFASLHGYIGERGHITLHENFARGAYESEWESFRKTRALTYTHTGQDATGTWVMARQKGRETLGAYGQYSLNDYILVFFDAARMKILAEQDGSSTRNIRHALTAGSSYSFPDGASLSGELYFQDSGLQDADYRIVLNTGESVRQQFSGGVTDVQAFATNLQQVGDALLSHPSGLRRHYAAIQYSKLAIGERIDLVLRLTHNLDDASSMMVADAVIATSEQMQIFATLLATHGDTDDEFRQFYDNRIIVGSRWSF